MALPQPRTVEIPVCYGGEFGPDLDELAAAHKLSWRGNLGRASELPGIGWYDKVEQLIATRYAGL
jgi:hypothetical protein